MLVSVNHAENVTSVDKLSYVYFFNVQIGYFFLFDWNHSFEYWTLEYNLLLKWGSFEVTIFLGRSLVQYLKNIVVEVIMHEAVAPQNFGATMR